MGLSCDALGKKPWINVVAKTDTLMMFAAITGSKYFLTKLSVMMVVMVFEFAPSFPGHGFISGSGNGKNDKMK